MVSTIWTGSISFGLVNVPVRLYSTIDASKNFSFNQLDKEGHRIRYKKWCPIEEREVDYSEIKKGYEIAKDRYVVIEKQDLEKIAIESTRAINIKEFIDEHELDPLFVEKSYYIAPDSSDKRVRKKGKESSAPTVQDKAYFLLVKVLHDTRKAAIGKVVLRGEGEQLVAIRAYQRGLVLHTLHYLSEIKPMDAITEISEARVPSIDEKESSLGQLLVENLTSEYFDISRYHDEYAEELEKLINAKAKGKAHLIRQATKEPQQTQDLIAALKASLERSSPPSSSPSSRTGRRKD
ncbi:MAG TPA: Ku protein [Nitrososphaeraceae archaeon]|jgi:DNA end-binding protein Ku|nr:Ku protein [Nitrososphaeraceae archaeon]